MTARGAGMDGGAVRGQDRGMAPSKAPAGGDELPRELLVLRHAKSDRPPGTRDFDRPLAKRGRRDAPRVGEWLREEGLVPDLVLSSPAARARETVERILPALRIGTGAIEWDGRVYEGRLDGLLAVLADVPATARRVLLVGHNPGLEDLVLHLGGDVPIPDDGKLLPTAAIARLRMPADWSRLHPRAGELVGIRRPREDGDVPK